MTVDSEVATHFGSPTNFLDLLDDRGRAPATAATYVLMLAKPFERLQGNSAVLYIGSTKLLGGASDRSRLYSYRFGTGDHSVAMKNKANLLASKGRDVLICWCDAPPGGIAVGDYEIKLRSICDTDHLEFPPFNRAR